MPRDGQTGLKNEAPDYRSEGSRGKRRNRNFRGLGNDIRGQGVLDERDSIAQVELALFQSLNLNDVLAGRSLQRLDRGIEVTVFLLQLRKLRPELRLFLLCHNRRAAKPSASFPKFVIPGGKHLHELRKQRGTSKPMIIVPLFDFEVPEQIAAHGAGTSNRRH